MELPELNEDDLRRGKVFTFQNEEHKGEIRFGASATGGDRFQLIFDGDLVKSTKTFKPVQRKMFLLIEEYKAYLQKKTASNTRPKTVQEQHAEILRRLDEWVKWKLIDHL